MDGIASWIERLLDGSVMAGGIFLVIGIIGGVLLLISLVLDGIFDAFDFGDGPLSLTTIAAFMAIFGFAAYAGVGAGLATGPAALIGALAGVVGGALAWWLSRFVRNAESTTAVSGGDLVGVEGSVVLAIPEGRLGEVAIIRNGERISLSATSPEAIPRGARVRVVQTISSTSVRVELAERPADEPVSPGDGPRIPLTPPDPLKPSTLADPDRPTH